MIEILIYIVFLLTTPDDIEALRRTAPAYLNSDTAEVHLITARAAAIATGTDASMLLSIAWHESRYQVGARGREAGGLVSCGVMTPYPTRRCAPGFSVRAEYLDGARHLRGWLDACRGNQRCALLGFAGGWRAIRRCADGPVWIRRGVDGCRTPEVFSARARWISSPVSPRVVTTI